MTAGARDCPASGARTHYEVLGVSFEATTEEIRREFRRQIARYHPDKVHHLGHEFRMLAETRTAELTQAYAVLMDPERRAQYDRARVQPDSGPATITPAPPGNAAPSHATPQAPQASRFVPHEFLGRAALEHFRHGVEEALPDAEERQVSGFDLAFVSRPRRALFRRADGPVVLLARVASRVDGRAVSDVWLPGLRSVPGNDARAVFLLGEEMASPRDLAAAITMHRRRHPSQAPMFVVPTNVVDWHTLMPAEAPQTVRHLASCLRKK